MIQQIRINPLQDDVAIWMPSTNGRFHLKNAWEVIRNKKAEQMWQKFLWPECLAPTTSIFLWRLVSDILPLDEKIISLGFDLASSNEKNGNKGSSLHPLSYFSSSVALPSPKCFILITRTVKTSCLFGLHGLLQGNWEELPMLGGSSLYSFVGLSGVERMLPNIRGKFITSY